MKKTASTYFYQYFLSVLGLLIVAFGLAGTASISREFFGPFPAELFTLNFSNSFPDIISVAVASIIYNAAFYIPLIIMQIKFKCLKWQMILGIIPIVILSYPLGFFLDNFYPQFVGKDWIIDLVIYGGGAVLAGFGFALFQASNAMNFPSSELCELGAEKTKYSFKVYRIICDVVSLIAGLTFMLVAYLTDKNVVYIGFGTIVLMFVCGYIIEFFLLLLKKNKMIKSFRQ